MTNRSDVAIIGVGSTQFGDLFGMSYQSMVAQAAKLAMSEAHVSVSDIDAAWLGTAFAYTYSDEANSGTSLSEALGFYGKPTTRVAAYCASGLEAIRQARNALVARECDIALVVGAEKMRDVEPRGSLVMQHIDRGHPVISKGRTAPGMFALVAERYASVYGDPREAMSAVAVKNHAFGQDNPRAHFRKSVSKDAVESAPVVSGRIRLLDACPTTDGAAAVVMTRRELVTEQNLDKPACLLSSVATSNDMGYFNAQYMNRFSFLAFESTQHASGRAYSEAGVSDPTRDIDVAEVHDCFTITEIVNYEDLGFCEAGEGMDFATSGNSNRFGEIPVNTSGGLKSCGHPVGATGVRMVVDLVEQLRGNCGSRQIEGAKRGLAHALGGPGSLASVAIVESA